MSLLNYFKRKAPQDVGEFLPNPMESSSISERSITLVNDEVRALVKDTPKRRKTEQNTYSIHMPMSKMKPLAAQWLVGAFDYLQENEQFAVNGFKEAGIFDVLTK